MPGIDTERWRVLSPYLDEALALADEERGPWLARLAAADSALADELEGLLAHHRDALREGFLEEPAAILEAEPATAGTTLGPYALESPLGHGGMGSVWLARRSDGRYEGKVAVKLIDAALAGSAAAERFRREGSILARLTHPHIARLLDAGLTPAGRPYLVLEHVQGQRIDAHCDQQALDVESRLRLFLDVLAAVAHAHTNLVVHRDIKPSNVLVTANGDVKLLDFGIAKLLEGETEAGAATELTREGGRALTPEYAAPEQVVGGAITTATDIYALGVLLYVLLGGQHPAAEATGSPARWIKAVVDVEAPRLSDIVTSEKTVPRTTLTANAAHRATTPERLQRVLRGDLDNIVAKAQKKAPEERYSSVTSFADDLRRYLNHQPVSARADTLAYRAAKFVRRNRVPVALTAAAVAALLAGLAGTTIEAERATHQAELAQAERNRADREAADANAQRDFALRQLSRVEAVNDLNNFLLTDAAPLGGSFTVGDLLARATETVEHAHAEDDANRVDMLVSIGRQYWGRDEEDQARALLQRAYDLSRGVDDKSARARAGCALAPAVAADGDLDSGERLYQSALSELPDGPQYVVDRIDCLPEGSEVAREAIVTEPPVQRAEAARALLGELRYPSKVLQLRVWMSLAESYRMAGRLQEAVGAFQEADERLSALGRENTETAGTLLNNWALSLHVLGRPLEAEALYRRSIRISSADGSEDSVSPMLLNNLARTLNELDRLPEAADYAERANRSARRSGNDTVISQSLIMCTAIYAKAGDVRRATTALSELEGRYRSMFPPGHQVYAALASLHSRVDLAAHNYGAALKHADDAIAIIEASDDYRDFLPFYVLRRADVELEAESFDAAQTDAKRAVELLAALGQPGAHSNYIGNAYLVLARALLGQRSTEEARPALASALEHLRATVGDDHPNTRLAAQLYAALPAPP